MAETSIVCIIMQISVVVEGGSNLGVIVVWVCKPIFQSLPYSYTWHLKKWTHSYTWSSEMLTYSYSAHWFLYPYVLLIYKYGSQFTEYQENKQPQKSLREKYTHILGCQKNGAFHILIKKKSVVIYFLLKKGGLSYSWQCWKRGPFGRHIRTMPYIGSYSAEMQICLLRWAI